MTTSKTKRQRSGILSCTQNVKNHWSFFNSPNALSIILRKLLNSTNSSYPSRFQHTDKRKMWKIANAYMEHFVNTKNDKKDDFF